MPGEPWFIYGLVPRYGSGEDQWIGPVVYIGKTDNPSRRVREHSCGAYERLQARQVGDPEPTEFEMFLARQWYDFNGPKVIILDEGRGHGWRNAERHWIATAKKLGIKLYNRTDGG